MSILNEIPAFQGRLQMPGATEDQWNDEDPIIKKNEAIVSYVNGVPKFKIGTGIKRFSELPYYDAGDGAYKGFATTGTIPPTGEGLVWYFATPGTYTHFLNISSVAIVVTASLSILSYTGAYWEKHDVITGGFDIGWGALLGLADAGTSPVTDQGLVWWFANPGVYAFLDDNGDNIVVSDDETLAVIRFTGTGDEHEKFVLMSNAAQNRRTILVHQTPGSGDYINIKDAITDIFDEVYEPATENNQIDILIAPGVYANEFITSGGLRIPRWVNLIGSDRETTVIRGPEAATAGAVADNATIIEIKGTSRIENLTIAGFKNDACVRSRYSDSGKVRDINVTFTNCKFKHYAGNLSGQLQANDVKLELLFNQRFTFNDCIFMGGYAILENGDTLDKRDALSSGNVPGVSYPQSGFSCEFNGCQLGIVQYTDNLTYNKDVIRFHSCHVDDIQVDVDTTLYLANITNYNAAGMNQPPPTTKLEFKAGYIGLLTMSSAFKTYTGGRVPFVADHMLYATNSSGVSMKYGTVVTWSLPIAQQPQNAVLYDQVNYKKMIIHQGNSRLVMGTVQDDFTAASANRDHWAVKYKGLVYALFDSAAAVSAGDALMASTAVSGSLAKWTQVSGNPICAYAIEALGTGLPSTQLIKAELAIPGK